MAGGPLLPLSCRRNGRGLDCAACRVCWLLMSDLFRQAGLRSCNWCRCHSWMLHCCFGHVLACRLGMPWPSRSHFLPTMLKHRCIRGCMSAGLHLANPPTWGMLSLGCQLCLLESPGGPVSLQTFSCMSRSCLWLHSIIVQAVLCGLLILTNL